MTKRGPELYDSRQFFEQYKAARQSPSSPNDTLEEPIFLELLGDLTGASILDLGCGTGSIAKKLLSRGAIRYLGIDGSKNMIEESAKEGLPESAQVRWADLEASELPAAEFGLVIARLVLHYIPDLASLFAKVAQTLKPGGRFVFSVEHPILTSCNRSLEGSGRREDWIVDDYFVRGRREVAWRGEIAIKYHRTIDDYLDLIHAAGLKLERLRESDPARERFESDELFRRRQRIPLFLLVSALKSE